MSPFTAEENDLIIAALRLYQAMLDGDIVDAPDARHPVCEDVRFIATNANLHGEPLSEQIDALLHKEFALD